MAVPALSTYSAGTGQPIHGGRWPGGRLSGSAALGAVVAGGSLGAQVSQLSGSAALGAVVASGGLASIPAEAAPYQVASSAIWGNSESQRVALYHDGHSYYGAVTEGGTIFVTDWDHATSTRTDFALTASGFAGGDHSAPCLYRRNDGRLLAVYSKHNDDTGIRYRIASSAGSIAAWGGESVLAHPGSFVTYSTIVPLSDAGVLVLIYRVDNVHVYRLSTDDGSTWGPATTLLAFGTNRPYPLPIRRTGSRLDMLVAEDGPFVFSTNSVYHCYAEWVGGALVWRRADGVALSLPINPQSCTKIYDGALGAPGMFTGLQVAPDGNLWALIIRWPSATTPIYAVVRQTGPAAWGGFVDVVAGGYPVLTGTTTYPGDACFDPYTTHRVYASVGQPSGGPWEIQVFDTSDGGASWSKVRDLTSGSVSTLRNMRPVAVRGLGPARVAFCRATNYASFVSFSSSARAAA